MGVLDLVDRALHREPAPLELRGIDRVRLRRPLVPGDRLELEVEVHESRARFALRVSGETAADGHVVVGAPRAPEEILGAAEPAAVEAYPSLDRLVPQSRTLRLVQRIVAAEPELIGCVARLPRGGAFDDGGFAPIVLAVEMIAQAAAAIEGLEAIRRGEAESPRGGYLASIADARFEVPAVPVAVPLGVRARLVSGAPPLAIYDGTVDAAGRILAVARVTVAAARA